MNEKTVLHPFWEGLGPFQFYSPGDMAQKFDIPLNVSKFVWQIMRWLSQTDCPSMGALEFGISPLPGVNR